MTRIICAVVVILAWIAAAYGQPGSIPLVAGVNDVPIVLEAISDQTGREDQSFSFAVPSGTFVDVDGGDTLMLSASFADGAPLPSWLVSGSRR